MLRNSIQHLGKGRLPFVVEFLCHDVAFIESLSQFFISQQVRFVFTDRCFKVFSWKPQFFFFFLCFSANELFYFRVIKQAINVIVLSHVVGLFPAICLFLPEFSGDCLQFFNKRITGVITVNL